MHEKQQEHRQPSTFLKQNLVQFNTQITEQATSLLEPELNLHTWDSAAHSNYNLAII